MIANFFRHLEQYGVKWLLVSGQATILYGAATFSEDIDLWVEPTEVNLSRFLQALRACGALYYKLTPPVTAVNAAQHHAFHFVLPEDPGGEVFLDVMGFPPRVKGFEQANATSRTFDTAWGKLHTVGIPDLVELKKTQRPRDYPIISRLALAWIDERGADCSSEDLKWALDNIFSLPELVRLFANHPELSRSFPRDTPDLVVQAATQIEQSGALDETLEDKIEQWMDDRVAPLRRADRHFWRPVIEALRILRSQGVLETEGTPV